MIFYLLFLVGPSFTIQVPRIPAAFAKSTVTCEVEFDSPVRRVYPEYSIVTGERFIAQLHLPSCSLSSHQTHASSPCTDDTCSDQSTSVVKVDNTTLYFCYSDNEDPKPFTANLLPNNTYEYTSGGLSEICLDDVNKTSFTNLNLDDGLLYVASGSFDTGLKYYNISKEELREPPSPTNRGGEVVEMTGMFVRGDYIYTVYLDKDVSRITRSCKRDLSSFTRQLTTFTVAKIQCLNSVNSEEVILDRVLALEFDSDLDKLFILTTKKPVTSSIVALCVIDVATDIDDVFDTADYENYDIDGKLIQSPQGVIDCSTSRNGEVQTVCVDPVRTSSVAATLEYTDVFTFTSYKTLDHHMFYFLCDDSIYVYQYYPDTDKTKGLVDVFLWEEASSISIYEDKLYLTLEESVFITDPYWCSFYGRDPIGCIGSMHPSCSYSKTQSRCLSKTECAETDECVQDLESGSFSARFPEGYSYQIIGTECLNQKIYSDLTVTIFPNSTVTTVTTYRDCSDGPVNPVTRKPDPVVQNSDFFSPREIGFLAGMAGFAALSLFLIIIVCKGKNKVNICNGFKLDPPKIKYTTEDKQAIVDPTTPTTPTSDCFNVTNGHQLVIRNPSANADDDLYDTVDYSDELRLRVASTSEQR